MRQKTPNSPFLHDASTDRIVGIKNSDNSETVFFSFDAGAFEATEPVFTDASKQLTTTGTVPVDKGGTGRTSATPYGVVIGGTTTTGAQQSVAVGTAGQILTSNGPGAAPTMQSAPSGTVPSSGTSTQATLMGDGADGWIVAESGVLVGPKQNLLSNTDWIVASGSTLCEVTSGAAPVLDGANAALVNNLINNGGVDSATTGFAAKNSATLASDAGGKTGNCLTITEAGGDNPWAALTATTVVGKLYQFNCYIKAGTEASYRIGISGSAEGGSEIYNVTGEAASDWTTTVIKYVFEATATTTHIFLQQVASSGSATTLLFDSVTLYEVTPGYVAADTLCFDGWGRGSLSQALREHNGANTKAGSFYAIKFTSGASDDYCGQAVDPYKVQGRTVTFGAWVKASDANQFRLMLYDGSTRTYSSYHTGGGAYEWLETSVTLGSGIAEFSIHFRVESASKTAYFSQPMLVYGSSIGAGNYAPRQGEIIWLQTPVLSATFDNKTGFSTASPTALGVEVDSSGQIGKAAKALYVTAAVKDSASASNPSYLYLDQLTTSPKAATVIDCTGLTNDAARYSSGWVNCDGNGDIAYGIVASGSGTLDIPSFAIHAVQLP